ncbi:MAG: hypothetical protein HDT14_13870 [Oscillibacter sp.]|nr:hypothetical protein [Oscillibacter sp.]
MIALEVFALKKNCAVCFFLSAILCIFLASCGIPKPPDESQIAEDLPTNITIRFIENPFDATNTYVCEMTVTSVAVEKRQTNEKEDIVYCTIELEDTHYRFIKHLKLNYNYYDQGGWCLDEYDEYEADEWKILEVPFDVEEASSALYNFSIAGPGTMTSDLANNIIKFSFPIEEVHANGAYKGNGLVTCQFDGIRWQCETNTDDIHFVWDILGTWTYNKIEETSYDKTVNEIEVTIQDFDQASGSMHGSWYMYSMFSFIHSHAETMKALDNPERVGIEIDTRNNLVKLWEDPNNHWGMHSYVEFYPDYVKADYATHFGPVYLERQYVEDPEDLAIWGNLIDQYFTVVGSADKVEIRSWMLQNRLLTDTKNHNWFLGKSFKQYTIEEITHSSVNDFAVQFDLWKDGLEYAVERQDVPEIIGIDFVDFMEFYDSTDFESYDDFVEVGVIAEFNHDNFDQSSYCFQLLHGSSGWELFSVR